MSIVATGVAADRDPLSLLDLVTAFCERTSLPVPTQVMYSPDASVTQIRALLEEEGKALSSRGEWELLTYEVAHTTLAQEDQGAMRDLCPNGFRYIKNHTIWDRTDRLPVFGPMNPSDWQAIKAVVSTGPRYRYRIRGGKLLVNPTPPGDHLWYWEYVSKHWILDGDTGDGKWFFTKDTDISGLPEDLVLMGLRWRWKKEKGLEYAEDFRDYELMVKDALSRDGSKPVLDMGRDPLRELKPGIFVPAGNWAVTP